jgi:hypothetical protein
MERLNQWLTLVANFGVVIGIVVLAYDTRLHTNAMPSPTTPHPLQQVIQLR